MTRPKRDIGHIDLYLGNTFIKTIPLWGYGYSTLQCANSLNYKYRIISLIIFKEWEDTGFSEAFEVRICDWDGSFVPYSINLDEKLMLMDDDYLSDRGIKKSQARVFTCLDAARYVAARIASRAYAQRRLDETIQVKENATPI